MSDHEFTYNDFIRYKNVSRETFLRLQDYVELLKKWQKTINLISPSTISDIWFRHIIDSVQLIEYIDENDVIADIGSGAGFPGLVLGMLGVKSMTLIESDTRKAVFLREAARITHTNIHIVNQRVEDASLSDFSVITARGFASIKAVLASLSDKINTNSKLLLLKGKKYKSEIEEAQREYSFDYKVYPSITDKESAVLIIQHFNQGA
jgi:16S rRNA (guanine527-N7)-methyltransferase